MPVLIYDGSCGFCCKWIERWKDLTGPGVVYRPSSEAAAEYPSIAPEEFEKSVQLVLPGGRVLSGAAAVLEITAPHSRFARLLQAASSGIPLLGDGLEAGYALVARHRTLFSKLTTWFYGESARRSTFEVSNGLFLRLLAVVFFLAILSFRQQAPGLVGSGGILPMGEFFSAVRATPGAWAPSLLAWNPTDPILLGLCDAGMVLALVALAGIAQPVCFFLLWAVWLSLVVAGQDFLSFQWDALLVETGLLAPFLARWRWSPRWLRADPHPMARFAAVGLLFKLHFSSGWVKLLSGDPAWIGLDALGYHFFTQPLPNPLAWFAHHLPPDLLKAGCLGMFGVELVAPIGFFMPRRIRHFSAAAVLALQAGIALTGNFAFFNLLTAALALLLIDDRAWRFESAAVRRPFSRRGVAVIACGLLACLSFVQTLHTLGWRGPWDRVLQILAPLRSSNSYGLFAVMTKSRRELQIEGSRDGVNWSSYELFHKPGDGARQPSLVAPLQPRLDWQLWFAALGRFESTPWMHSLLVGLLKGRADVVRLFESNPFPHEPPRWVRVRAFDYRFADPREKARSGHWWVRTPLPDYCPPVALSPVSGNR